MLTLPTPCPGVPRAQRWGSGGPRTLGRRRRAREKEGVKGAGRFTRVRPRPQRGSSASRVPRLNVSVCASPLLVGGGGPAGRSQSQSAVLTGGRVTCRVAAREGANRCSGRGCPLPRAWSGSEPAGATATSPGKPRPGGGGRGAGRGEGRRPRRHCACALCGSPVPHRRCPSGRRLGAPGIRAGLRDFPYAHGGRAQEQETAFPDRQSLRPQKHALGETRFKQSPASQSDLVSGRGRRGSLNPFPPFYLCLGHKSIP